jgi:Tol biopolymer transport system component
MKVIIEGSEKAIKAIAKIAKGFNVSIQIEGGNSPSIITSEMPVDFVTPEPINAVAGALEEATEVIPTENIEGQDEIPANDEPKNKKKSKK